MFNMLKIPMEVSLNSQSFFHDLNPDHDQDFSFNSSARTPFRIQKIPTKF